MIFFRGIKRRGRFDLRHNRLLEAAALIQAGLRLFRRRVLFGGVIKNHRTILVADIGPLTIQGGRIVIRPEDIQELIVTNDRRIELHLHDFGMPGAVSTHLLVGRIFRCAAGAP